MKASQARKTMTSQKRKKMKVNFQTQEQPQQENLPQGEQLAHLKKLKELYELNNYEPNYQIRFQADKSLEQIQRKKQILKTKIQNNEILNQAIKEEDILMYGLLKEKVKTDSKLIRLLKQAKNILSIVQLNLVDKVVKFQRQISDQKGQSFYQLEQEASTYANLFQAIHTFEQNLVQVETASESKEKALTHFKISFYTKIYKQVIEEAFFLTGDNQKLKAIFDKQDWPLKRNQRNRPKQNISSQQQLFIKYYLHTEACQYALCSFIFSLTGEQKITFESKFFKAYFQKTNKAIQFMFIAPNQSHSLQEPNWMFEYMHETFSSNYLNLKPLLDDARHEVTSSILIYIVQYCIQNLFLSNIQSRLQTDLPVMKESYSFYRFLDTLHDLQQKLSISFHQEVCLLQNILVEFQVKRKSKILDRNFDYEHDWVEQKIFKDFYDINYSAINLKNIEAYNIVSNFNILFEKLYSKFATISEPSITEQVDSFYQQVIRNLVAHIKTSFDRIYNHSGLNKLEIILAFKRVENQFKSGLQSFISKSISFDKEIRQQYYDYVQSLFNVYALEELGLYQRRLLKAITENQSLFQQKETSQAMDRLLEKGTNIFKKWHECFQNMNKVYSFRDTKIKSMFFAFLESSEYSEKGISCFLQLFQPFLKISLSQQGFSVLKMVVLMDKKEQIQYLDSHHQLVNFLTQTEINSIKKIILI